MDAQSYCNMQWESAGVNDAISSMYRKYNNGRLGDVSHIALAFPTEHYPNVVRSAEISLAIGTNEEMLY